MTSELIAKIFHALKSAAAEESENLFLTTKPHDEYLRIVGRVQGLRLAMELIEEAYTEHMKS